jgi:DNA-binding transcriptional regulator YiaG
VAFREGATAGRRSDCVGPETWRPIPGFEGLYHVSNKGRIRSLRRGVRILQPNVNARHGYRYVHLWRNGERVAMRLARVVLLAFVGECPPDHEAAHEDGDRENDALGNLSWKSHSANMDDRRRHGTAAQKLSPEAVGRIRSAYAEGVVSQQHLASRRGVSKTMIRHIVHGRAWVGI